jgi:hypothetical protein
MRRFSPKPLIALGLACFGALALPSCATNDSMIFIVGVYARKQGACTPKAETGAPLWANGTLDRLFATDYTAALVIGNQITTRGSREQLRTETSRVALRGAEVKLETPKGVSLVDPFSSTATGFVDAASGTDPALSIMYASLIPPAVALKLPQGTLVAKVRVFGDTLGGQEVESSELWFPIDVCDGCLVAYPASARDLTAAGTDYQCKVASDTATATTATDTDLPCEVGIDVPTPCTTCSGTSDACLHPKQSNPTYAPAAP